MTSPLGSRQPLDPAAIDCIRLAAERADKTAAEAGALALDLGRYAADLKAQLVRLHPDQVSTLIALLKRLLAGQAEREARLRLLARQFAGLLQTIRSGAILPAEHALGIAVLLDRNDVTSAHYCDLALERRKRMPIGKAIEAATEEMANTCREIESDNGMLLDQLNSVEELLNEPPRPLGDIV